LWEVLKGNKQEETEVHISRLRRKIASYIAQRKRKELPRLSTGGKGGERKGEKGELRTPKSDLDRKKSSDRRQQEGKRENA